MPTILIVLLVIAAVGLVTALVAPAIIGERDAPAPRPTPPEAHAPLEPGEAVASSTDVGQHAVAPRSRVDRRKRIRGVSRYSPTRSFGSGRSSAVATGCVAETAPT